MNSSSSQAGRESTDAVGRLGPVDVLLLAAWCGLAAGELEVAIRLVNRAFGSTHQLYHDDPALRLAGPADQSGFVPWAWCVVGPGDAAVACIAQDGAADG